MEHVSLCHLFRHVTESNPEHVAYRYKKVEASGDKPWVDLRWRDVRDRVDTIARALLAQGVEHGDRVAILSQTRIEWILTELGNQAAGGVTVGVYPASIAEECAYVIDHCDAVVLFVEDADQLAKVQAVRDKLPKVKRIIRFDGDGNGKDVLSWQQFLDSAEDVSVDVLETRIGDLRPDDLAMLVYTSGTTGVPKGVMISHKNLMCTIEQANACLYSEPHYRTFLFLPLAHVFARLIVATAMSEALTVVLAESIQTVAEDLRAAKPHFFASVPRIFEKVHEKITSGVEDAGGLKKVIFDWSLGVGSQVSQRQQAGQSVGGLLALKHKLAHKLVFAKIHAAFGGQLVYAVSGAAPLNRQIAEFFHACGILILEGFGMTENTSFSHVNRIDGNRFGTVGQPGPDIECKIASDGEILTRGDNVMQGYFKNQEATAETIDEDGWLRTGDVGEIDDGGYLRITDRKKDLIITAGGKNVAPQRIEQILRTSRYISQAVAVGDRRKFIAALITVEPENIKAWAEEAGLGALNYEELVEHDKVRQLVEAEIARCNQELASYESVKRFALLPSDLTVEAGELTASLKVRRRVVMKKYEDKVEALYAEV